MWALWVLQATTVNSLLPDALQHKAVLSNISDAKKKNYIKIQIIYNVTVCCSASNSWCFEDHNAIIRVFLECVVCRWKHNLPLKHLEVLSQWYSVTAQRNWTFSNNAERTSNLAQEPDIHCNFLSSSSYKPWKIMTTKSAEQSMCMCAHTHFKRTVAQENVILCVCVCCISNDFNMKHSQQQLEPPYASGTGSLLPHSQVTSTPTAHISPFRVGATSICWPRSRNNSWSPEMYTGKQQYYILYYVVNH
jgi:hypothetical protein